jgi:predicted aspartyl protease
VKALVRGEIVDFVPLFNAYLGELELVLDGGGDILLTVDTGFSGGVALPKKMLDEMDVEFIGYDTFSLATGEIVELPMFLGKVIVKGHGVETWFIPGDLLVGMEFLSIAGSVLTLDFKDATVKLMG